MIVGVVVVIVSAVDIVATVSGAATKDVVGFVVIATLAAALVKVVPLPVFLLRFAVFLFLILLV